MNLRVHYPLWNIVSLIPLFFIGSSIILREGSGKESDFSQFLQNGILVWTILLIIIVTVYSFAVWSFNKKYPMQKINPFSFRPNEYIEEDEMFMLVTMQATKKVHTFMAVVTPALFGLSIFATRLMIFSGIFVIIIIQNMIFYNEVKQYTREEQ